jgi:tetratricopeptide (TPR) repeat protein
VNEAYQLLEHGSYGTEVEAQLLRATGRLQICAGWLCFDAGRHEQARTSYMGALALARPTGDAEVETRAFANLAFQSNLLKQPREALRFARAAEMAAISARDSSRVAAIPHLRVATASSLTGDVAGTDRAITLARKALDSEREHPTAEWCAFLSPLEIDAVEATCAVKLGRATHAERLLEQAIDGYSDQHARNRALYRVRLAQARLEGRAVDGAVEAADAALDDLGGELDSWRVSSELDAVVQRLATYAKVAGVDAFVHRYAAMNS